MLGASESYLGALAVELGHRDVAISLLATLPLLAGALAQLAGPRLARALGGEKRLVVLGASLQALSHVGFAALALFGSRSLLLFLAIKVCYWVSFMVHAPAWSAWMSRLVPRQLRARYFARRMGAHQAALLVAFLGSGFLLEAFRDQHDALRGFALLHSVALAARLGGSFALSRQARAEPTALPTRPTIRTVLRAGRWRVALFAAVMMCGAQIAVPFFTPYMLQTLGLDFGEFAALLSVSIGAKVLSFPIWRRAVPRLGALRVLALSGFLIAVIPLLWVVFDDFGTLALAQIVGGVAWAGYELVSLELLMGDAPKDAQLEFFALAGSFAGVTQVIGSVLGGVALRSGALDYHGIFVASAGGRAVALLLLVPLAFTALRRVPVIARVVSVRPSAGEVRAPVLADEDGSDQSLDETSIESSSTPAG